MVGEGTPATHLLEAPLRTHIRHPRRAEIDPKCNVDIRAEMKELFNF